MQRSCAYGCVASLEETREAIDGWDGLLLAYGVCFVPVLFAVLIGFNLNTWAHKRINYTFIFGTCTPIPLSIYHPYTVPLSELDTRTRLDHREYFEVCHAKGFLRECYLNAS